MSRAEYTLYRMFDRDGSLLYVGQSIRAAERFSQHRADKSWWPMVSSITMERCDNADELNRSEREAIQTENPRFNVVHASGKSRPRSRPRPSLTTFTTYRKSGRGRNKSLWLTYEITGDPISDDYAPDEITARELFQKWDDQYGGEEEFEILWFVGGDSIFEFADTFLDHYWIADPLYDLPVRVKNWSEHFDKGGFISEAHGWEPWPLQPTVTIGELYGDPEDRETRRDRRRKMLDNLRASRLVAT